MSVDLLIPRPLEGERSERRFFHWDVPAFTAGQLWAETVTLEAELARRIALQVRPRLLTAWPARVTDHEWIVARLRVLRAELHRRGYPGPTDRRQAPRCEGV